MNLKNYSRDLLLILISIIVIIQITCIFLLGSYNLLLLILSSIIGYFIWQFITTKHTQTFLEAEVVERANSLMGPLQQAIIEKNIEEPLLASQNSDTTQLNTRLQICSVYLIICIIGVRQSNGKPNYTSSKEFTTLLTSLTPHLKKIYVTRKTKTPRIPILIQENYHKIKKIIECYCSYNKKRNSDPTLVIQAWFEEKSRINLADKPYIFRNLSEFAQSESETKLLHNLCQPKKHTRLLDKIRDKTEVFMTLISGTREQLLQQTSTLDYHYIQKYLSAFLLIFGLVVIKEANGNTGYLQSIEYQALKNKASTAIKSMILNSRYLGVESLDQSHIESLVEFMNTQLPSVQAACVDYCNANQHKAQTPEIYLLEWFKTVTNDDLNDKNDLPLKLKEYIQQI